ncbi:MAG: SDR family oxidoreductase [Spirochaetia bacterium]|nr:SDR family oxidoreductase [Spirochaetia bacterium]
MDFKNKNYWALILGGSSGFGLATAKKLSSMGMNICVAHRDRKGSMAKIEEEFNDIKKTGVQFLPVNTNALTPEGRAEVLEELKKAMGPQGRVRLVLHSIAFGNLKLIAPLKEKDGVVKARESLASKLGVSKEDLTKAVNELFEEGVPELFSVADYPPYQSDMLAEDEDVANTVYSMGTNLLTWVQDVFSRKLFADDARVIGLTSEGNTIAWRGYAAVSAAKVAMEAVSRSIAVEFAPHGIRSNIIQAGVTDTPALRLIPGSSHMRATTVLRNPMKRLTETSDVADFIALMCTDEAGWVNGDIIRVDGGEHISG